MQDFDWDLNQLPKKKGRTTIKINCDPKSLWVSKSVDFPNGVFWDSHFQLFAERTDDLLKCRGESLGSGSLPIILLQANIGKSATSETENQSVAENAFVIYLCHRAQQPIDYLNPDITISKYVGDLSAQVSLLNTREKELHHKMDWTLGEHWKLLNMYYYDSFFLATLFAIAQEQKSFPGFETRDVLMQDLWKSCFQSQAQRWSSPRKSTMTAPILLRVDLTQHR